MQIGTTSSNSATTGTGAIENAGLINNIDNEGVIGGTGDSYGIDNQGNDRTNNKWSIKQ